MAETENKIVTGMIDLADLDTSKASDKGAEIELNHPSTEAPLGIFITVLGKDSEVFREHGKNRYNEDVRREAAASRRGKSVPPYTAEELEEKAIETLVLCSLGWRTEVKGEGKSPVSEPCLFYKGEKLAFNVPNCKRVYAENLWIRRQVDDAIGDLENFMKGLAN